MGGGFRVHVACDSMLHVVYCMLHVVCGSMWYVACCMWYVACCTHAACESDAFAHAGMPCVHVGRLLGSAAVTHRLRVRRACCGAVPCCVNAAMRDRSTGNSSIGSDVALHVYNFARLYCCTPIMLHVYNVARLIVARLIVARL